MTDAIFPLIGYLLLTLAIALWAQRQARRHSGSFFEEYFLGNRTLGGFVLAMTIIASYTSASSFVGGPGVAYKIGFGWVLLAMIQVPTAFFTLGVLGKRFAIVGRQMKAVTITDFLFSRYRSDAVVIVCSLAILVFFIASMTAQFIGGARVFQSITGYSYETGLILFGICVIAYTTVGGFRAVALTDALQGIVMLAVSLLVLLAVVSSAGGVANATQSLRQIDPGLISPFGPGGSLPVPMLMSFWVLVGIGILGLPQTVQRCFAYKDSQSMHTAMILGTLIIGFLLLCMHLAGAFGRVVVPDLPSGDLVIPTLITRLLPPFWAGIFVAGPLAAIMSTVDTMLLIVAATLVKDLYVRYALNNREDRMDPVRARKLGLLCTAATGILVFIASFNPPDLLVWINLFAFGGLEAVFLWPIILGLYFRWPNAHGAIASMLVGLGTFIAMSVFKIPFFGMHPIVPTLVLALLAFLCFNPLGKPHRHN